MFTIPRHTKPRSGAIFLTALFLGAYAAAPVVSARETTADMGVSEQRLVEQYMPVTYLKRRVTLCDPIGEPYVPTRVEIAFGDPEVTLRQVGAGDPVVVRAPTAKDLYGRDASYYLDLLGTPRKPGCEYARKAEQRMRDLALTPSTYAHIAREEGRHGIAIQYWLYWYFNRFNDKHESDWEMIQVVFDHADTVEDALAQEPARVAYAQHEGGEASTWTEPKLQKVGSHPIIYSASGSHASYYGNAVWMGWGDHGTGFGCDVTTGPSERQPLVPVLVPTRPDSADSPDAWLNFGGLWGQKESWVFDGPQGPNLHRQWLHPISWTDGLRHSSLKASSSDAVGLAPARLFCNAVALISGIFTVDNVYPIPVYSGLVLAIVAIIALGLLARPPLRAALAMYRTHASVFLRIGLMILPLGFVAGAIHLILARTPSFHRLSEVTNRDPVIGLTLGMLISTIQPIGILLIVGPAVTQAVADIRAGRRPSVRDAYRVACLRFGASVGAAARWVIAVGGMALTIVGIPWAIRQGVRWGYFDHAVIVEHANARAAFAASERTVRGRWWQALAVRAMYLCLAVGLGPLVGVILLLIAARAVDLINFIGSLLFACTVPLAAIATSIWYLDARAINRDAAAESGTVESDST